MHRNLIPKISAGGQGGFTLIEVMASALLVVLIAAGVAQGLIAGAHLSAYQRHRSQADELAQQDQERLRGLSATQLNDLDQTVPVTLDGTNYTVTSTASFLNSGGGAACGSTGTGAAAYYSTSSTVSWKDVNGTHSLKEEGLITPPAGGSLLVKAVDQTGSALPGVTVTTSGTGIVSGTTDSNGCVIMTGLAAGDYNLSIAYPGYVDPNGDVSPLSATASVTSSGTASPSIGTVVMGDPGTINVTGFTTNGGALTGQTADSVSWYGAGATYSMQNSASEPGTPSSQLSSFTVSNLFPFWFTGGSYANDYQVWAGPCRQMQPPTGMDAVASGVTPGSTQSMTVQEPAIDLSDSYNGGEVQPYDIKVMFTSQSGSPACSHTWSVPVASSYSAGTGWMKTPGQPFASLATSGSSASASGLTGTEQVCVDIAQTSRRGGTSYYKGTSSAFQNNNFTTATPVSVTVGTTAYSSPQC